MAWPNRARNRPSRRRPKRREELPLALYPLEITVISNGTPTIFDVRWNLPIVLSGAGFTGLAAVGLLIDEPASFTITGLALQDPWTTRVTIGGGIITSPFLAFIVGATQVRIASMPSRPMLLVGDAGTVFSPSTGYYFLTGH